MSAILILIPFAALALGRRLFVIISHVNKMEKGRGIVIRLSWIFYAEQALTLACVAVLLMAISPVKAAYAIAAILGVFLDLLISVYYYSIRAEGRRSEAGEIKAV